MRRFEKSAIEGNTVKPVNTGIKRPYYCLVLNDAVMYMPSRAYGSCILLEETNELAHAAEASPVNIPRSIGCAHWHMAYLFAILTTGSIVSI